MGSFSGNAIDNVRFKDPWPTARFRDGRHFMDKRFKLPLFEGSTIVPVKAGPSPSCFLPKNGITRLIY